MKTQDFNPVSFLQSDQEIADFLSEAYKDPDPNVFVIALGDVVKHKGLAKIAREAGLNRESLYKTFSGKVKPQWETIHKLMNALHFHIDVAA